MWAFKFRESADVTILDLQGRATIGVDSDLLSGHLQMLVAKGVRKLLLNLADLTQLDSSGIGAIIGTYVSISRQGGRLKLFCPCGRVRAVLRVIRLPDIIPTFEDEAQALASFRPVEQIIESPHEAESGATTERPSK